MPTLRHLPHLVELEAVSPIGGPTTRMSYCENGHGLFIVAKYQREGEAA